MNTACQGKPVSKRYLETKEVVCFTLQMEKSQTAFFLHALEACDNLAFPTTLPFEQGSQLREILLRAPIEHQSEIRRWLEEIGKTIALLKIEERIVLDN
jgi:hypothetical protein